MEHRHLVSQYSPKNQDVHMEISPRNLTRNARVPETENLIYFDGFWSIID